jgi:hypothetical protein
MLSVGKWTPCTLPGPKRRRKSQNGTVLWIPSCSSYLLGRQSTDHRSSIRTIALKGGSNRPKASTTSQATKIGKTPFAPLTSMPIEWITHQRCINDYTSQSIVTSSFVVLVVVTTYSLGRQSAHNRSSISTSRWK